MNSALAYATAPAPSPGSGASSDYARVLDERRGSFASTVEFEILRLPRLTGCHIEVATQTRAVALLRDWRAVSPFVNPHKTATQEGEIVFEWWHGERKLVVYITPDEVQFIKVWGVDLDNEMEDGTLNSTADVRDVWAWLYR